VAHSELDVCKPWQLTYTANSAVTQPDFATIVVNKRLVPPNFGLSPSAQGPLPTV